MDELTRLLLAARDGDRACLAAWIRQSQPEVWRLCAHLVDRGSADDLAQEAYLRAWKALPAFRADASARTWLLSITRRVCADELRRRTRRRRRDLLASVPSRSPVAPDPAETVPTVALFQILDAGQREAFVLTQVLGLSYAEAAEACDCPVGTIRSRVARARLRLVHELAPPSSGASDGPRGRQA